MPAWYAAHGFHAAANMQCGVSPAFSVSWLLLSLQSQAPLMFWCFWLQRICNAEYQVPGGVEISPELETLLQGMLEPTSSRRLQVADILEHPWFTEGLPPGVVEMNARLPDGPKPGEGQVRLPLTAPFSCVSQISITTMRLTGSWMQVPFQQLAKRSLSKCEIVAQVFSDWETFVSNKVHTEFRGQQSRMCSDW